MRAEQEQSRLQHIDVSRQNGCEFPYGRARALFVPHAERKNTRSARKKAETVLQTLGSTSHSFGDQSILHDNGNAFTQVKFDQRVFYVDTRSPIGSEEILTNRGRVDLNIVSGPCLFSAESARAIGQSDTVYSITTPGVSIQEPIKRLDIDPWLSLYEIEALSRLPTFIQELLKSFGQGNLHLNIPQVEYYLYMLPAYEQGMVRAEQLKEWFTEVDRRHLRLFSAMARRSTRELPADQKVEVYDSMPLAPLKPYLSNTIQDSQVPNLETAVKFLSGESALWENILTANPPKSWGDLNSLSYVYAELSAGYSEREKIQNPQVAVVVENPTESKIFSQAKKIVATLPDKEAYNVIPMYPHEMILPAGDHGRTMYHVPGQLIPTSDAKIIFRAYAAQPDSTDYSNGQNGNGNTKDK